MHDFSHCHDSFCNFSSRLWEYGVFEGGFSLFLYFLWLYSFQGFLSFPSKCLKALLSASNNLNLCLPWKPFPVVSQRLLRLWHYLPTWFSCQHFLFPELLTHKECPGVLRPGHKLCLLLCSSPRPCCHWQPTQKVAVSTDSPFHILFCFSPDVYRFSNPKWAIASLEAISTPAGKPWDSNGKLWKEVKYSPKVCSRKWQLSKLQQSCH